jgi:hypothetical protein
MAESDASESSSVFSLNTLLTVVTIIGGLLLVSPKLKSDRPQRDAHAGTTPLGYQDIESRLWEDPFAAWEKLPEEERTKRICGGLTSIVEALTNDLPVLDPPPRLLVLGVFVSGQPYAEDEESRVRSRYAIGAALGAQGYESVELGHIGLAACRWPDHKLLDQWVHTNLITWGMPWVADPKLPWNGSTNMRLRLPFEAYSASKCVASDHLTARPPYSRVMLLWLDEEYFDDTPAPSLALLRSELQGANSTKIDWAIIGPRTSSGLRNLLKTRSSVGTEAWSGIQKVLSPVRLILATPSAMDEVLFEDPEPSFHDFSRPRRAMINALSGPTNLFQSVVSFANDDRQLAAATLEELGERKVNPITNGCHHVVLISESDTFFSRMNALAFAGEVWRQASNARTVVPFVQASHTNTPASWPSNVHRFVYFQGLDGETVKQESKREGPRSDKDSQRPTSVEEIRKWTPEANKAEGAAQFDYVARLGDQVVQLEQRLWREQKSHLAAVGIIGSDVYDTLLVLQALRHRLPNALFFANDLDARFWDPTELPWTRNLLVFSGYGLQLSTNLQGNTPPFRESAQCAQFLATLSAIQAPLLTKELMDQVPIRRFEIGRRGPVDLSPTNLTFVHPGPRRPAPMHFGKIALAFIIPAAMALLTLPPLRRLAWPVWKYCAEPLVVGAEDFDGEAGVQRMSEDPHQQVWHSDALAAWFVQPLLHYSIEQVPTSFCVDDVKDPLGLVLRLKRPRTPISSDMKSWLSRTTCEALGQYRGTGPVPDSLIAYIATDLNRTIQGPCIHNDHFEKGGLRPNTLLLLKQNPSGSDLKRLNRLLIEDIYPEELKRPAEDQQHAGGVKTFLKRCNTLVFMKGDLPDPMAIKNSVLLTAQQKDSLLANLTLVAQGQHLPLTNLRDNRVAVNAIIEQLVRPLPQEHGQPHGSPQGFTRNPADYARELAMLLHKERVGKPFFFWTAAFIVITAVIFGVRLCLQDTYFKSDGEPFNLMGTSAWPAEFIRFAAGALSILAVLTMQRTLSQTIWTMTRQYRFKLRGAPRKRFTLWPPGTVATGGTVDADELWGEFRQYRNTWKRFLRVLIALGLYITFAMILISFTARPESPIRGATLLRLDPWVLGVSGCAFLFMTFWIIDSALLTASFIDRLSQAPTRYSRETLDHFAQERSIDDDGLVEEWIDVRLIADLTQAVGRLVYWPFVAFLLMLLARNPWWDHWTWPWTLIVLFAMNMLMAAASSVILHMAAQKARKAGVHSLHAKINAKKRQAAPSVLEHEASQGEELLDEIKNLRRGAFAPLSKNPLIGGLLLNSSGAVLIELLATLFSK